MLGKNIKYSRLKNGLTKKALAEKVGISSMAITHYENGERTPDMQILRKLTDALQVKLVDLLRNRTENHEYAHGEFRRNSTLTVSAQEYVRENVEEYFDRFFSVIDILGDNALPKPPVCHAIQATGDAEADAAQLRKYLGFAPEGPVMNLVGAMENKGVLMFIDYIESDKFSGMNGLVDDRPFIIINSKMTAERQRSTLVHELAHVFFAFDRMEEAAIEKHATAIGGAFLFPKEDAERELGLHRTRITSDMVMVAKEYGISMLMLVKRASLLRIISMPVYEDFMIQASQHGWRKNEPSRIDVEYSDLFDQLVIRAIGEDEISPQKGAELLKISYAEMIRKIRLHEEA